MLSHFIYIAFHMSLIVNLMIRIYPVAVQAIIQSITRLLTKKKLTHRSIAWISRREKPSPRPADFSALLSDGQHTSSE